MRLKQLLRVLLSLLVLATLAAAAAPQLTHVSVVAQGNTTVLTLRASGAFTHNEYRPADNLLLIDLPGVSVGKLQDRDRVVQAPGVKGYHVVSYSGAAGVEIARVEVSLSAHPEVKVNETKDGLVVEITGEESASTPAAAPAKPAATVKLASATAGAPAVKPAVATVGGMTQVRDVTVVNAADGVEIDVVATNPITGKATTLANPDRIVVDVPNAAPARFRHIPVNSGGVRGVRVAQFQADPPVTRIVVDLKSAQTYDVVESGSKLTLKVHSANAEAAPKTVAKPVTPKPTPAIKPATAEAKPVMAESKPQAKPVVAESKPAPKPVVTPATPQSKPAVKAEPKPEVKTVAVVSVSAAAPQATIAPEKKGSESAPGDVVVVQPTVQQVRTEQDPNAQPPATKLMAANTNAPAMTAAMAAPLHQAPQAPPPPASGTQGAVNFSAEQRRQQPATNAGPRYTGEPISVNLKDVDLKDFFRLIHEISGLNVVLDPSVNGSLTLVLDDVPWDQALDIVLKNNGLDRQLEGNVLRIATVDNMRKEAEARRRQIEAQALAVEKVTATRFLSYAHAKDVLPTLKKMLSARGDIVADDRTNALIIDDIPSVIPGIDALIAQLDRKTQEVEIEARIVAATRSFARDIGTQLAFGFGNHPTAVGGGLGPSPITDTGTSPFLIQSPGSKGAIPLFSDLAAATPTSAIQMINLGSNYRLDAILTMAESRGLVKILSRPRVITQNNIQAIVKQGQRVPVVTQAQLSGPPTVTYVEAVLRLTVTPQITVENTIFLNVDIENTSPDFANRIFGNPVFMTQQATTQVLVTNGGTAVIGGVIQSNNSVNINQVPLLGSVPVFGNLFKRRGVKTDTQELIFFLTPRIVET